MAKYNTLQFPFNALHVLDAPDDSDRLTLWKEC